MFFEPAKKIWHLLTSDRRRYAVVLLGLTLIGTLLETLSVGIVVPVIGLLTSSDVSKSASRLAPWLASMVIRLKQLTFWTIGSSISGRPVTTR